VNKNFTKTYRRKKRKLATLKVLLTDYATEYSFKIFYASIFIYEKAKKHAKTTKVNLPNIPQHVCNEVITGK